MTDRQSLVTPTRNANYNYISNATVKYYSQDFQTVFHYSDTFGHNERILINAGDGCNEPTYDDMVYYNNGISSFIKRQPLMGLVARGGCSWSTKINNLQSFVQRNSILDMTAMLIYDNTTFPDNVAPILFAQPSSRSTPAWNSAHLEPTQRNISTMLDNDVHSSNMEPFMAIYFVPRQFGLDMLAKMNNYTDTLDNTANSRYVRLAPYFTDTAMDDNPVSTSQTNGNGGGNSGQTNFDSLFGNGNRGYIAYIVAAGVAIILAIILFRWCRKPRWGQRRTDDDMDVENQVRMHHVRAQPHPDEPPCIPIEKLNSLCPIQSAEQVLPLMKNTVCAICLDDFKPACQLRLLPCHHGFCVGCIDVWLTKKSSLCPICKYDCSNENALGDDGDLGKMTTAPNTTHASSSSPLPHTFEENNPSSSPEQDMGQVSVRSSLPPSYSSIQPTLAVSIPEQGRS